MDEPKFLVKLNFNRLELDSWIDLRKRPDGDYDGIGMGRSIEYDATTGAVVSDRTSPTGVVARFPCEMVEGRKPTLLDRLLGLRMFERLYAVQAERL